MTSQHLDYDALNTLKEVMEGDFAFLLETFIQDSQDRLQKLQGLQATSDADSIRRAAHSFKGSCSNIGALRLASLCAVMERKAQEKQLENMPADVAIIMDEFSIVEKLLQEFLA